MSRIVTLTAMIGAVALSLIAAPAGFASDEVGFATDLVSGITAVEDTSLYDTQHGEPNTIDSQLFSRCETARSVGVAHTAWFRLEGSGGPATVTTAGSALDTALFAYDRSLSGPGIACNDDSGGAPTSSVTFPTVRGAMYYVQTGTACTSTAACMTANGGTLHVTAAIAPNPDSDGDGIYGAAAGGADCNDNDLRIHPGALDVPGDGIDQNCDGRDAAIARPKTVRTTISLSSSVHRAYTRIARLTARNVPAGATLTVSCATRALGCRFATKSTSVRRTMTLGLGKVVGKSLTRAKLRKGAKLEVRVASPGQVGTVTRFTVRKGKTPTEATLCLPPGATKPRKTCS